MTTAPSSWAVVGGGMLGLSLAERLAASGHQVTVFEANEQLGGLAAPWQLDDVEWDRHYHVTLLSDQRVGRLLDSIGLADETTWVETKAGYYAPDGRLHPMSNAIDYLKLPALNPIEKARLAATILWGSRVKDWQKLETIPVEDWLRKWSGQGTFDKLWLPLLRAKLSSASSEASAAFIWATIQRLYAAREAGIKKEMFGYVRGGGYARTLRVLAEHLTSQGVELRPGTPVLDVTANPGSAGAQAGTLCVRTPTDQRQFDHVVMTTASPLTSSMCPDLTAQERQRLDAIRYQGVICASLLLDRPLTDYYLTYITEPSTPFTTVVEMTAFVDPEELGGHHLVYLPKYVPSDDPLFSVPDHQLRQDFLAYLMVMHPDLEERHIRAFEVSRVRNVFAVPTLNYSASVPPMTTSVPGLFVVNSSQIINGTLNVEETLGLRDRALETMGVAP